jgi:hypothetical protein
MLWIEDTIESTLGPPFLTNSRIDMVGFMDPHNVIVRRNAFLDLPSAQNRGELEGGAKSGRLSVNFHKWKGIWICKKSLNWYPSQRKIHQGKK